MTGTQVCQDAPLQFDESACINICGRLEFCGVCRSVCEWRALSPTLEGIHFDASRCTACGACVPACPTGAIRPNEFSPRDFLQSLGRRPAAHIHCVSSATDADAVPIPCHKLLDARLLAAGYARGTASFHLHGLGQCGHCPKGSANTQVASLRTTLQAWFGPRAPRVIASPEDIDEAQRQRWQRQNSTRARRNFLFGGCLRATAGAATWLLPPGKTDDPSPGSPPDRTMPAQSAHDDRAARSPAANSAANYQALLLEHVADLPWQALPWKKLVVTEACSACLACGQRCPTGALSAWSKPARRGVSFDLGLCTSCGLCQRICPEQAIDSAKAASVSEVVAGRMTLVDLPLATCPDCRRTYVADADATGACPACRKERTVKEEWLGLLGESPRPGAT